MRVLVAEDDVSIADALVHALRDAGHVVDHVADGSLADLAMHDGPYDAVVLDLGMPRMDGVEVIRRARQRGDEVGILVVTARDAIGDRVQALDAGADDFLIKPFVLAEFSARIRALLRRRSGGTRMDNTVGLLRMETAGRQAWIGERSLLLSARESALLELLMNRAGRLVTRSQATDALCAWDAGITDNGLDIAVHRLRRKLEASGARIRTVRGLGYLIEEQVDGDTASA